MQKSQIKTLVLFTLIISTVFLRLIPHPANFTPIAAVGLFGAAYFSKKWQALLLPLVALFISDLIINNTIYKEMNAGFTFFYEGFYWQYLSIIFITIIGFGFYQKKVSLLNIGLGAISSTVVFYLVSNFGVWASGIIYPMTPEGLGMALLAGIPFVKNFLISTCVYSLGIFGVFYLLQSNIKSFGKKLKHEVI